MKKLILAALLFAASPALAGEAQAWRVHYSLAAAATR